MGLDLLRSYQSWHSIREESRSNFLLIGAKITAVEKVESLYSNDLRFNEERDLLAQRGLFWKYSSPLCVLYGVSTLIFLTHVYSLVHTWRLGRFLGFNI